MKFPAQFVLQVAENESRAWWGMREAICCLWDVNVCIVAQHRAANVPGWVKNGGRVQDVWTSQITQSVSKALLFLLLFAFMCQIFYFFYFLL